MKPAGRIAVALVASLLWAAPAAAEDYCVGDAPECVASLALALDAARTHAGPDRVLLGAGEHEVPDGVADAPGEPVEVVGAGPGTQLTGALWLDEAASRAIAVSAGELRIAGMASRVAATGPVRLLAGGRLSDSTAVRTVTVTGPARVERTAVTVAEGAAVQTAGGTGPVVLENLELAVAESADLALDVQCSLVTARHLTITGSAPAALRATCEEPDQVAFDLRDSVIDGDFTALVSEGVLSSAYSVHAEDAHITDTARLDPGSSLVDAGAPEPLQAGEGFWDLGGRLRVTDGNGDGMLRRDVGARELQPRPAEIPAGNVLLNPGAEDGEPVMTTGEGPQPPAWTRTGSFTQVAYGTAPLPTPEAAEALGGGGAFFSAGPGDAGTLLQRIDLTGSAAEIDTGLASAALAGLLGGYGADEDEIRVTATFRDPEGGALSALTLGPVTPAERANGTTLLHRDAAGAIPERTRAIDVEIIGTRVGKPGAETYTDAYADNLSLVLSVPGIPVPGPVDPATQPPVKNLRPFSGVTVLTGRPKLSKRGRTKVRIACASATVGRCAGSLELRAQLRRGQAFSRIAQFARFSVAPGRAATVTVKLTLAARRALRRRKSFRATLRAVARDGQGLERRTTIPVRVRR